MSGSSQAGTSLSLRQDAQPMHAANGPDRNGADISKAMHQGNPSLHTTGRHRACLSTNNPDRHVACLSVLAHEEGPLADAPSRPDAYIAALAHTQQLDGMQQGSPPGLDRSEQVSVVPDTPASDGVRDSAPQQQPSDMPTGGSRLLPAQQGLHMASAGADRHVASSPGRDAPDLWHQCRAQPHEQKQGDAGRQHAGAPPVAGADASFSQLASAPELALDLGLSIRESQPLVAPMGQGGVTAVPHQWLPAAWAAQPLLCDASQPSLAAAAAGPQSDAHLSSGLRPSTDKETPLVQCAQLAANVSTDGSRVASGTAPKVCAQMQLCVLLATMRSEVCYLGVPSIADSMLQLVVGPVVGLSSGVLQGTRQREECMKLTGTC